MYYKEFQIKDARLASKSVFAEINYNEDGNPQVEINARFQAPAELPSEDDPFIQDYCETISFIDRETAKWFLKNLTAEQVTELLTKQTAY
jgi:hypothetical protein